MLMVCCATASCHSSLSPKETATDFVKAMQGNDFSEAKKYATTQSKDLLEALATTSGQHLFPIKEEQTIAVGELRTVNDETFIMVTIKETRQQIKLSMKKEWGSWKVAYDMNTLMRSAFE